MFVAKFHAVEQSCYGLTPVLHQENFFRVKQIFSTTKSRHCSNSLFTARKVASENVAPVGIKLRMHEIKKIRFARKNSPSGNRLKSAYMALEQHHSRSRKLFQFWRSNANERQICSFWIWFQSGTGIA